ncbi:MAG: gamma carbonic anhydrase family protein [Bacilli bacterium]|nr:gamma carbonic anhydrase family protein [Bacilli bacterium]MBN2877479.1 gamma carbonic anhydrase family protein [Bacilli bacterium]
MYKNIKPIISKDAIILPSGVVVGEVTIEALASVWFNATVRGDMARITIGEGTNIQDNAVVHTDTNLPTHIGKYVTVGHSAIIHAATVGDHALIGMGSVILNKAVVGEYAMVAAGTLVPPGKVIPPRTLVMGNPMRIVRELTDQEIEANHHNAMVYIELSGSYHDE